ncbi:cation transporter [Paenibacillus cisolokensis]|jgi:Copper chaperone|uniref:Copper chaperone CopZ n=1 Tax=Paenibacillus cisolokensis TaxID=1658519 RepID=A0ABQ4NEB6_9BACL|nr:cation transporter [Paenibacillus cisolokensis]GIQ66535.1 copper chaperone CopZ [Paenibacillus cisolokensis]
MTNIKLQVNGMSCRHCVVSVEGALKDIGASGKVDLENGTVEVTYDENRITTEQIKAAIEEQGYDVV